MYNLIKYCCDKGLEHFENFKFERNSRIIMREHFVSNKDVIKYELMSYVHIDRYGRYKLPKYFLRKFSNLISDILHQYVEFIPQTGEITKRKLTLNDVRQILLNPNGEVDYVINDIKENLDKDLIRNRTIKIWNIKNKIKLL